MRCEIENSFAGILSEIISSQNVSRCNLVKKRGPELKRRSGIHRTAGTNDPRYFLHDELLRSTNFFV